MYQHNVEPKVLYNDNLLRVSYLISKAIFVHCEKQVKTGEFWSFNINGSDRIAK